MRTEEFNGHTITYPDETCFAFNPQIITIDNLTGSVIFYVGDYSDMRDPISGKVSIDISEYLRSLLRFDYATRPNSKNIQDQNEVEGQTIEFKI